VRERRPGQQPAERRDIDDRAAALALHQRRRCLRAQELRLQVLRIVDFKLRRCPRGANLRFWMIVTGSGGGGEVNDVDEEAGSRVMEDQIELCGGVKTNSHRGVSA
jgi:hypothetical protein